MVQERTSTLGKDPWAHCQPERDLLVKRPWPSGRVLCWIAAFPNFTAKSCQMSEKHSFKGNNFMPKYRPKSRQFIGRIFLEKSHRGQKKVAPIAKFHPIWSHCKTHEHKRTAVPAVPGSNLQGPKIWANFVFRPKTFRSMYKPDRFGH